MKKAVLFSVLFFFFFVNCLICLQYGMLTLLMLHPELEKKKSPSKVCFIYFCHSGPDHYLLEPRAS